MTVKRHHLRLLTQLSQPSTNFWEASMPARLTIRPVLSVLLVLSILLSSVAPVVAAPAVGVQAATARATDEPTGLYRTRVAVESTAARQRLARLNLAVLEEGDGWLVVLVDEEQLADLARLGFTPRASEAVDATFLAGGPTWLTSGLAPVLTQAATVQQERRTGATDEAVPDARYNDLRASLRALSPELAAALAATPSLDDDGDGLTNTEEAWWCTDPANPNSDGDAQGYSDGEEVAALLDVTQSRQVRWGYGPPFGPPNAWPDFNNRDGDPNTPACNDGDYDTIPDFAEVYVVGTRVPFETTDNDKFDDGQELFGVTFCPGAPTNCGYGSYPGHRILELHQVCHAQLGAAARRQPTGGGLSRRPKCMWSPESWHVERVTTITTAEGQMTQSQQYL